MATLTATVIVRHPESGEIVPLLAGEPLPDWAADLVGEHALEKPKPARRSSK